MTNDSPAYVSSRRVQCPPSPFCLSLTLHTVCLYATAFCSCLSLDSFPSPHSVRSYRLRQLTGTWEVPPPFPTPSNPCDNSKNTPQPSTIYPPRLRSTFADATVTAQYGQQRPVSPLRNPPRSLWMSRVLDIKATFAKRPTTTSATRSA